MNLSEDDMKTRSTFGLMAVVLVIALIAAIAVFFNVLSPHLGKHH